MTTTGNAIVLPLFRAFDANGDPLAGGKLYTWTTPAMIVKQPTYSDAACTAVNANPVVLDSAGQAMIYLKDGLSYTLNLTDSADVQQSGYPIDGIYPDRATVQLRADLADTTDVDNGDAMIGVLQPNTGAVATTQHEVNSREVNVWDYLTAEDRVKVLDYSEDANDVTYAFTAAKNALWVELDPAEFVRLGIARGGTIRVPRGYYRISNFKMDQSNIRLIGEGTGSTIIRPSADTPCIVLGGFAAGTAPWPIVHCEISQLTFTNKQGVASTDVVKYDGTIPAWTGLINGRAMSPAIYIPHPETATEGTVFGSINDWHVFKDLFFGYFCCSILVDGNLNSALFERVETNACTLGLSFSGPFQQSNNFTKFTHCSFRYSLWVGLNLDATGTVPIYSTDFDNLNIENCGLLEEASLPPYGGACGLRLRNVSGVTLREGYFENNGPGIEPTDIWTGLTPTHPVNGSNKTFACSWEFTMASELKVYTITDGIYAEVAINNINAEAGTLTLVNAPAAGCYVAVYHQGDAGGANIWISGTECTGINIIGGLYWQSQVCIRVDAIKTIGNITGTFCRGTVTGGAYNTNYGAMLALCVTATLQPGSDVVLNSNDFDVIYVQRDAASTARAGSTYVRWIGPAHMPPITVCSAIPNSFVDLGEILMSTEANASLVTKGGRQGQVITIVNRAATNLTAFHAEPENGKFWIPWGENLVIEPGYSCTWQLQPIAPSDPSGAFYWHLLGYTQPPYEVAAALLEVTGTGALDVLTHMAVRVDATSSFSYATIAATGLLAGSTVTIFNGAVEEGETYTVTLTHNAEAHMNQDAIFHPGGTDIVLQAGSLARLLRMPANPAVANSKPYWVAET